MSNYVPSTHTGTGAQTNFNVPWPYLDKDHVSVSVDGVNTAYTWVDDSTIQISPAPANGASVAIFRTTPGDVLVNFNAGFVRVADQTYAYKQPLFRADEVQADARAAFDALTNLLASGKVLRSGSGAPSATIGYDGDFYLDATSWVMYGPKASGAWPLGVSLIGAQGPQGVQGPVGPAGPSGPQGPAGPSGSTGPQGPAGTSVRILGTMADPGSLPSSGNTAGDGYLVSGNLYVWSGTAWTNVGSITGPAGATGPAGPAGATGAAGVKGDTGAKGATGATGAAGPAGPQGIKGDTGATGPVGPTGASGSLTGRLIRAPQYLSGTSYTTPADCTFIFVEVMGAGGGGGGSTSNSSTGGKGGGGGAGGFLQKGLTVTPSTSYAIQIGVGGAGSSAAGSDGTASSITVGGTTYTANGGGGGKQGATASGAPGDGGTATGGDINKTGSDGGEGTSTTSGNGRGGDSFYSSGGVTVGATANGSPGGLGAGGSGGRSAALGGARNGGNGGNGMIRVWEYAL